MNAVVAGTELRGAFEARMQSVMRGIKEHPNLILFIDEAQTLVGAGSPLGAPTDAANILKSVLALRKLACPLGFLSSDSSADQVRRDITRDAERRFAPEFLNRIDEIVLLDPLRTEDARAIALQYLDDIHRVLARAGKTLRIGDDVVAAIVAQGHSTIRCPLPGAHHRRPYQAAAR